MWVRAKGAPHFSFWQSRAACLGTCRKSGLWPQLRLSTVRHAPSSETITWPWHLVLEPCSSTWIPRGEEVGWGQAGEGTAPALALGLCRSSRTLPGSLRPAAAAGLLRAHPLGHPSDFPEAQAGAAPDPGGPLNRSRRMGPRPLSQGELGTEGSGSQHPPCTRTAGLLGVLSPQTRERPGAGFCLSL